MSDLYNRIMSLCEEKGVSGYRMCKDIKIQPSVLTDLKMGRQTGLSAKNADKIAAYLGVSVGYLLGTETKKAPSKNGEGKHRAPSAETLKLLELLESREDIRYLAAASEKATPEHVKATAEMFDKMYGRHSEE